MTAETPSGHAAGAEPHRASIGRMAVVAILYLAIVTAAAIYPLMSPLREDFVTPLGQGVSAVTSVIWLATLLVSMQRQPAGPLWKLIFLAVAGDSLDALTFVPNSVVWSVANVIWYLGLGVLIHLLVAFPSGHLRDRFDRGVVLLAYASVMSMSLGAFLLTGERTIACTPECVRNVFVIWSNPELFDWYQKILTLVVVDVLFPLVLLALWRHWRGAGPAARRTLLPLIVAVPLMAVGAAADWVSTEFQIQPLIDFFDSPPGFVISAGVPAILPIGLLLGILRARLGRGRIANLVVELGRGVPVGGLRDVLARTLGDPTLQLAFTAPSGTGFVDASGQAVELPRSDAAQAVTRLERDGELLGVLVHDPAIDDEDLGLVEAVGNAARLALENERLAAEVRAQLEEVRASRMRIVEAADAERRRVERDLHDGAQQRLVALAMRLQVAKQTSVGAAALLDEATEELQTAIGEVRGLARGVHPTILTEAGLAAAVDSLAERTPVPMTVDVPDRRYEPQIEATAYFVIAEALTNVARYASASQVWVRVADEDGRLVVEVVDNGRGGADPRAGSGLRGLTDRLAAVGGALIIHSPSGGGTTLTAELPLATVATAATIDDMPAHAASSAIEAVRDPQQWARARRAPGRDRLASPLAMMATVVIIVGLIGVGAAVFDSGPKPPIVGRADTFAIPFYYEIPGNSGIKLYAGPYGATGALRSDHLHVLATSGNSVNGISIWVVGDVLASWCPPELGPPVARQPGMSGLLAYLHSIDRIEVLSETPMTVDGRTATHLVLALAGGQAGCRSENRLVLWRDAAPPNTTGGMQVSSDSPVHVIVFDVGRETLAIEIWSPTAMESWLPRALAIIDSIRFLPPSQ